MKVSYSNYVSAPQFKSKYFEKLAQSANLKKPFDKMTKGDCEGLHTYVHSLQFRLRVTPEEINELLSKNGVEFLTASANFFKQKLGFSDGTFPPTVQIGSIRSGLYAAYALEQNIIYLSKDSENIPKPKLFGLLRHEYQHAIQNHNILRTEGLGEEAVEYYAERSFNKQKDVLLDFAKNYSVKELLAQGLINDYGAHLVSNLAQALQKDDEVAIENILRRFKKGLAAGLNEFREKLIMEKGLIKADSRAAKIATIHFDEFKNIDYFDENGNLNLGKHAFKVTENEAEMAQLMAESEMSQTCFIKLRKDNLEELSKNKSTADSIDEGYENFIKS